MIPFGETYLAWLSVTVIPAFVGLVFTVVAAKWVKARYLAGLGLGIFLWFFVDTLGGAAYLDVNSGFGGGAQQAAVVGLFVVGVLVFILLDKELFSAGASQKYSMLVPALAALAAGMHGFGEGTAFGSTAAVTRTTDLLQAFGGGGAGLAFALHKAIEPMMVGAVYVAYSPGMAGSTARRLRDISLLALIFVVPAALGAATGYFIDYDATYFFALGLGSSIYLALRLAKVIFTDSPPERNERPKFALAVIIGFILIYAAALLHS